jgi:hypothetical protein
MVFMINDGLGHKEASVSQQLGAKTQIDIFLIGKESFIEETDFVEQLLSIERRRAAGTEDVSPLVKKLCVPWHQSSLVGNAKETKFVAGAVDAVRVREIKDL